MSVTGISIVIFLLVMSFVVRLASGLSLSIFAISICDPSELKSPTIVAAQAANELLDIVGIKASFVLTEYDKKIYISARSIDEIDVQRIMERLGGGGHLNLAGAQVEGVTLEETKDWIKKTLDTLLEEGEIEL